MNIKEIYNLSIIGLGSVGLRHLESLFKLDLDMNIYLIDIDDKALSNAKKIYKSMKTKKINNIYFLNSLIDIKSKLDLMIISCNSANRKQVLEETFKHNYTDKIILEKIVFQSSKDFINILIKNKILKKKLWVNCNKRCFPVFQSIKNIISKSKLVNINVEGGNWNIASNAIHFLDIFYFLTENICIKSYSSNIEPKIYQSKRSDYIDLNGEMSFSNSKGSILRLSNFKHLNLPVMMYIQFSEERLIMDMTNSKLYSFSKINDYKMNEKNIELPHLSDFSYKIIENILIKNECGLINLNEAHLLHKPLFNLINQQLFKITGKKRSKCPIT